MKERPTCMVMGYLAGPQETLAMWSAPVKEVIVVLEGFDALLHQQCELTDCQVVVAVSMQNRLGEGRGLSSFLLGILSKILPVPLLASFSLLTNTKCVFHHK